MHKFNMSFVFSFLYSWNRRLGSEQALQLNGWNLRALQNETHVRTSILNTASSVGSWAPPHSTSRAWRVPEWACVLPYSFDGWRCSEGSGDIRRHPDFKGSIYATTLLVGSSYSAFQLFCPPPFLPCAFKSTFWSIPSLSPSLFCPIADKVPGPTTKLTPPPLGNVNIIARREREREGIIAYEHSVPSISSNMRALQ